jgi:hypothetical protein
VLTRQQQSLELDVMCEWIVGASPRLSRERGKVKIHGGAHGRMVPLKESEVRSTAGD